jgi:hypothetical protein
VLDGLGVEQPAGVENNAGAQELDRFLNLGWLGETPDSGGHQERVDYLEPLCRHSEQIFPGEESSQHLVTPFC